MRRTVPVLVAVLVLASVPAWGGAPPALWRIELDRPLPRLGVPVAAALQDASGRDYALAVAPPEGVAGLAASLLDRDATGASYLVALERRPGARDAARRRFPVLLDDGRRVVVRDAPGRREELAAMGFDLEPFEPAGIAVRPREVPALPAVTYDPEVADMIADVGALEVWDLDGKLSGLAPVTVDGGPYTIQTRHTASGVPIQKATEYVLERFQALGLATSEFLWSSGSYAGRNIVGEIPGVGNPDEIVLITAHLDDMPSGPLAPGADDNASGSTAVLMAAEVMAGHWFDRTVRFVLFTGEEQGLLGSSAYAAAVAAAGENVVAVVNLDMIGWDGSGGPVARLHTRTTGSGGYADDLVIAQTLMDVVSVYGLAGDVAPQVDADGITASDHASFWNRGYPAILVIEDDEADFNPYYHTTSDTRDKLDMAYMTALVKAAVGAVAHLAGPATAPCQQGMVPLGLAVDTVAAAGSSSNLNGVLELGERAVLAPGWRYPGGCSPVTVTGTAAVDPVAGLTLLMADDSASYGLMMPGEETDCIAEGGNCYTLAALGFSRPAQHLDVQVTETLSVNRDAVWTIHVGESFGDVPPDHWAYRFIETLYHEGITAGCGGGDYCPGLEIPRWQMAVFLTTAITGGAVPTSGTVPGLGDYACGAGGTSLFADVAPTHPACAHIHYLAAAGITAGCGGGDFCPDDPVDRWQMAVFLTAGSTDPDAVPPSGTVPGMGPYDCSPGGVSVFADVPPEDPGCRFIHYLAAEGITAGCGGGNYCPASPVTRAQMAVFITATFDLSLVQVAF